MDETRRDRFELINPDNVRRLRLALATGVSEGDFMPAVFVVEPTSRCNLGCIMCPNSRLGLEKLGDAPLAEFERTLKEIAPYAEMTMLYFMGESTLHPEFLELMKSARRILQGKIALSTNAFDLTDQQIDVILASVDILIVPIDRWNAVAYESIRKHSNFATVVDTAERMLARRGDRESPIIIVKGLDIHLPTERSNPSTDDEARAFIDHWESRGARPLAGWLNSWAGQMPGLLKLTVKGSPYESTTRVACADLWFKMVINWRGHAVLCCHNWNYSVDWGNVAQQGVAETWHSSIANAYRTSHAAGDWSVGPICRTCREWADPSELDSYLRLNDDDLFKVF